MHRLKKIDLKGDQILVFRSTIDSADKVSAVIDHIGNISGVVRTNIDLNDCDNVLRIECDLSVCAEDIVNRVLLMGFGCSELPD